jgi:phospholipid/cholesterol/gamma-HCH transport system substrate-binding protein
MEIRARYTLIGLFTLSVIAAVFGFVYWLNNAGGFMQRALYQARFESTVSGLLKGSAVLFNGIRVGEVVELKLTPDNPRQVMALFAVERQTPVRADTKVGIEFQGLMGSPVVSLRGGVATAQTLSPLNNEPPLLSADADAGQNMTDSARNVLRHIDTVVTDNSEPLKTLIANINTFSGALARNTDRVDGILSGLERMTGGGAKKAAAHVFDLIAPRDIPPLTKTPDGQLLIPEPEILGKLFNDEIQVRAAAGTPAASFEAKWPDALSRVMQSRIIQSFENANYLNIIGRQPEGLTVNYQLFIDVRRFQVTTLPTPVADIQFSAKIVGDNGKILGAKLFQASVPASIADEASVAASLNDAFGKAVTELVVWTCKSI